jgi:GH15 family glucan-1,4-alpha-glucosidase
MALPIEDYALIGDTHTAALVGRNGSIDWLCLPRFDVGACFAALLGDETHGRWLLTPVGDVRQVRRKYREGTLVLESEYVTDEGTVRLLDCMPHRHHRADVVRLVQGINGQVAMRMELIMRFDYGWIIPWVRRRHDSLTAIAGPDALCLRTPVETRGENLTTVAEFTVSAGQQVPFALTWHPSTEAPPPPLDVQTAVKDTESWWRSWSERCDPPGRVPPRLRPARPKHGRRYRTRAKPRRLRPSLSDAS